jgi:biopolymer transport protein ExbD
MKHLLEVCLIATALTAGSISCPAGQNEPMQKGISVEMAGSTNAVAMPEADAPEAWIVTLNRNGQIYFGTNAVSVDRLDEEMVSHPRKRTQKLYIKADAHTRFADVERVLEAARRAEFSAPVLLTAQAEAAQPGSVLPPQGLEVLLDAPSAPAGVTVQIVNSDGQTPTVKVDAQDVTEASFPGALKRAIQDRHERMILLKADSELPYAEVVHVIDSCHATGANVLLLTPTV